MLKNNLVLNADHTLYTLYVKVLMTDGNPFDCVAELINSFLARPDLIPLLNLTRKVETSTFGEFQEFLICDPNQDEFEIMDSVFTLISFDNGTFEVMKLKGKSVSEDHLRLLLKE